VLGDAEAELLSDDDGVGLVLGLGLGLGLGDAVGEAQSELCAFAAGASRAPNATSATPKSASAIAAPSAADLRSSALTVQPRIT
jgi:hypothetical protein